MKRYVITIILLFLVAAAGILYFPRNERIFSGDNSLYDAVPVSSPFFFEFHSLRSIPLESHPLEELANAGIWPFFFRTTQKLDSLIEHNESLSGRLRTRPFILSFGFTGRSELVPLIITKAGSNERRKALESLLNHCYPPEKHAYKQESYGKHTILQIDHAMRNKPVFLSFTKGVLLISPRSILVERAIRQLTTGGLPEDPYFMKVCKTANASSGISFFLNHANFGNFAGNLVHNRSTRQPDEFGETPRGKIREQVEGFQHFAQWSELDLSFSDNYFSMSGISAADDSLNHFLPVFEDQQPVRFSAEDVLPGNTAFFCSYAFSEKTAFFDRLDAFFTHSDIYYLREERMKRYQSAFRADFKAAFQKIVKDEVIVAATTIPVDPANKTVFFIVHTKGKSDAEEQLTELLQNYSVRKGMAPDSLMGEYVLDGEVRFPVYRFPFPSFPGIWLGSPFGMAAAEYVTFFDNFMVFANSEQGIREYLRSMELGATLGEDMEYQRFRQNASNRSNINVYVDVNKAFGLGKEILSESLAETLGEKAAAVRKFRAVNWQVQRDKNIYFNSVGFDFRPQAPAEPQTTWQSTVGSITGLKPQLVENHDVPGEREIIVQDEDFNLYQLTGEGRVRWSIPLSGPVLSEIHQVDYYKNGHLQYLFNTRENLYLIDRNGNNVAHFPVEFRSPATNGVNVFDYNNNRDYRYFVACENKKVVAYDRSAKIVTGWKFEGTDHRVTNPVQHFRIGNRDYIVFNDPSRIYIQNRRGATRVETSSWFDISKNPLVLDLHGTPKIVATDTGGKVHYVYFDGRHEEKETGRFSENHFFTVDDLNGNDIPDFVFVDGNVLTVMDENGKRLFREKMDHPLSFPPNIYTFASDLKKIGIVDATANRIFLYNPDGKLHRGFPFQGNSEFTVGKLSDDAPGLSLIVGSEGGKLYHYLLN